jgi:hypothetical protein
VDTETNKETKLPKSKKKRCNFRNFQEASTQKRRVSLKEISFNNLHTKLANRSKTKQAYFSFFKDKENVASTHEMYKNILSQMDNMNVQSKSVCIFTKSTNDFSQATLNDAMIVDHEVTSSELSYHLCIKELKNQPLSLNTSCDSIKNVSKCDIYDYDINNNKNEKNEKTIFYKSKLDPSMINDIYELMIKEEDEKDNQFDMENYKNVQTDINGKMRAVLIDWLIEVHRFFQLSSETLFVAIDIIDKYLCKKFIDKNSLQLLGISSMWIALKYIETSSIEIKCLVYVTDNSYSEDQIRLMEKDILSTLSYNIASPSLFKFYELLCLNFQISERYYYTGRFLIELFMLDLSVINYKRSLIACSVLYIVMKLAGMPDYHLSKNYTNENERTLKECARNILYIEEHKQELELTGVINKYSESQYHSVGKNKLFP